MHGRSSVRKPDVGICFTVLPIIDYTVVEDDAVRDVDVFADDAMLADDTSLHRSLFANFCGFADEAVACI